MWVVGRSFRAICNYFLKQRYVDIIPLSIYIHGGRIYLYTWRADLSIYMEGGYIYIHGGRIYLYTWREDISIYMEGGSIYIHGGRIYLYTWRADLSIYMEGGSIYVHGGRIYLYTWRAGLSGGYTGGGGGGQGVRIPTSHGSAPHLQGPYLTRALFITNVISLLSLNFLIIK